MTACNSGKVKKWIWNGGEQQNAKESHSADHFFHPQFYFVQHALKMQKYYTYKFKDKLKFVALRNFISDPFHFPL